MGSDSGAIGVEVDALYLTGKTISERAAGGRAAADGLQHGLDTAGKGVGHDAVKKALSRFVDDHVEEPARNLPRQVEEGGHRTSDVAATARDSDNAGAAALTAPIAGTSEMASRINRQI